MFAVGSARSGISVAVWSGKRQRVHACAVRGRAVVGAAPGSWVPEGAGTAVARVLRAEAAVNWGMRSVARVCVYGRGKRGKGGEAEAATGCGGGPGPRLLARPRARAPGRGQAHLCAGSSAPEPRGQPCGSSPRPTAPSVLGAVAAARPLSGIPAATPVGAARLQGRVRPIPASRSRTAPLPRVCGQRESGRVGSALAKVTRVGPERRLNSGLGTWRRTALLGSWFLSDAFY